MSKKLSKYIAFCDYLDKSLIVLSATSGSVSIVSFATVMGHQLEQQVQVLHFFIVYRT